MSVILRVTGGPQRGEQFTFHRHDTLVVGRRKATISIPEDGFLSRNHFLIEVDPPRCLLKDLGSRNGTLLNGVRVADAIVQDGDRIRAGQSEFIVTIDATFGEIPHVPCLRCRKIYAPSEVVAAARPDDGQLEWVCDSCKALARRYPRPPAGYWIERRIGGGGMGEVYLARRSSDRSPVAIKMMIPTGAAGDRAKRYFLRELEVLRDLRHPNIVEFYETVEIDGQFQLVMEYVDGPNASEWVKRLDPGPLSPPTAAWIGVQLLAALEHAHAKGYVHRDIKPSNLLISGPPPRPVVKLSDFGLAKSFRDNAGFHGLTHQGDIGGSVGFISPDHIREFSNVKEPADIYSTGATLYYLLTGKYPFLGFDPTRNDAYMMILEHPAVPVRAHRPDVPEGFERVLKRALMKKPKDRWRSAAAMAEALWPFTVEEGQP
jgi:serine/threonine-protein kinase